MDNSAFGFAALLSLASLSFGGAACQPPEPCSSARPLVGWTANLVSRAHGVSGTAAVVDESTIEIRSFNYDGGGLNVRAYGGSGGDYSNGFPIGPQLLRPGQPYENETLTLPFPAGKTLADLDGIAIWCVQVAVSFGDGCFEPP